MPLRALLIGGLGSAGLVAFSIAAFSFFSGLADPRVRNPRPMTVAAAMPDLKDGLPVLTSETGPARPGSSSLPQAATAEPPASQSGPATSPLSEASAPPAGSGSVAGPSDIGAVPLRTRERAEPEPAAKAAPSIQNAAVIVEAPRTAALVAPARAETVKAKVGQPSAFVSLPAESQPAARSAPLPRQEAAPAPPAEVRKPEAKPPVRKIAAHRPERPVPVADAAPVAQPAAPHTSDDGDVMSAIPGGQHLRAGWKAIGGVFGGSDGD